MLCSRGSSRNFSFFNADSLLRLAFCFSSLVYFEIVFFGLLLLDCSIFQTANGFPLIVLNVFAVTFTKFPENVHIAFLNSSFWRWLFAHILNYYYWEARLLQHVVFFVSHCIHPFLLQKKNTIWMIYHPLERQSVPWASQIKYDRTTKRIFTKAKSKENSTKVDLQTKVLRKNL